MTNMESIELSALSPQEAGPWTWPRGGKPYVDKHGVLNAASADGVYAPFDDADLPNAAAKIVDERSALRFARAYGLLGYSGLLGADMLEADQLGGGPLWDRLTELDGGDPLEWVIAQSQCLRFALEIVAALQGEGDPLEEVLARHRSDSTGSEQFYPAVLRLRPVTCRLDRDAAPEDVAASLLKEMTSSNTRGVKDALVVNRPTPSGFQRRREADALVEAIWWHVGQWAADGVVRLCDLRSCRTPFLVTDQRQRFCPGETIIDPKTGEARPSRSRCAALHQKRRQRQKGE